MATRKLDREKKKKKRKKQFMFTKKTNHRDETLNITLEKNKKANLQYPSSDSKAMIL